MRILVTGGAGYIGSVVVEELLQVGHELTVYDSLTNGYREAVSPGAEFVQADLLDCERLKATLRQRNIEVVIHTASDSLETESVQHSAKHYHQNLLADLSLLGVMKDSQVTRLIFSSTAAVYGELYWQRIEEADPKDPTTPRGERKLAFERALHWHERAYGLRYATLRYFNVAGATARCGEWHTAETHLIPLLLQVAAGRRSHLEIYGDDYPTRDGTCVRDYLHVVDLARAYRLALSILNERSAVYNVGCGGDGFTVKEVISCAIKVTGKEIPARISSRRREDPAILVASSKLIRQELGWSPENQGLENIIQSAWDWLQAHPNGYQIAAAAGSARVAAIRELYSRKSNGAGHR
jgi:UDP-glucose 4-epimerase